MKTKIMYKTAIKMMSQMGLPDIETIEKGLLLGPGHMMFSEDKQTYMKENQGVQVQHLKSGEKVVIDVSEIVGRFLAVNSNVDALRDAEQRALELYAVDKASCIESYRRHLRVCQKHTTGNMASPDDLASTVITQVKEQLGFTTDCLTLAALHQTIFDKPMRVFRAADIHKEGSGSKHLSDMMKKMDVFGHAKEFFNNALGGNIEKPMCTFRCDGSLYCKLQSHILADDHELLDMSSVLRLKSRVSVLQSTLADVIKDYQAMLRDNKKSVQEQHRNIYQACMDFIKLRSKTINAKQWARFQEQCMKLVALRLVLHNKDIPYADKDEDDFAAFVMPKSQEYNSTARCFGYSFLATTRERKNSQRTGASLSARHGKSGEGTSSSQPAAAAAGHKDVGSSSNGATGSGGFVRTAKAEELYGKMCMLGDATIEGAHIRFEDIADEPDITVMLKSVLGATLACVTDGKTLSQMLDQARKRFCSDRHGAKLICDHLLEACRHEDASQLMDLLKIGCKGVLQKYEQLVTDCMQHLLLRCVVYNAPIQIVVGRAGLPPIDEADVIINNMYSEQDLWAVYLCDNLTQAC